MHAAPSSEDALAEWEGEGGSVRKAVEPCLPSLPRGYEAQTAWGFRDRTERFAYEFNRVYGPNGRLDRDRSYWSLTWPTLSGSGDEHPAGRWMSYARARKQRGSKLTFARFSSVVEMRDEIVTWLNVADDETRSTVDRARP